ncbi:MAG: iron-containing alcohol dehydrogenase [Spirochaetales bacterium]|nr:iron-containing alcohol dehydrogenase [Spirochaetales bacterium]
MNRKEKAAELLKQFKGVSYHYGKGALDNLASEAGKMGKRAFLVHSSFKGSEKWIEKIIEALEEAGVELIGRIPGGKPNAPREDLFRISDALAKADPDLLVTFGGGSNIDLVKAAEVLRTLGGSIEDYFGVGKVTEALAASGKTLTPHIAIQAAASSAAHLTKYSNITDTATGQKKLIVDEAIVPQAAFFDYEVTLGAPSSLTMDGALDGVSHSLEVLYSASGKENYDLCLDIALTSIGLVIEYLPRALENPGDYEAREAMGLATDMGGYSIMVGGTNGGHLTSFSLVDLLSHGRACALMNPYYTVFFAPAVEDALKKIGVLYREFAYSHADFESLSGRTLGLAAAEAMFGFSKRIGFPLTLGEVEGFNDSYIERALDAAKNPQLKMKLQNMPIPLVSEDVDPYMGPILRAAKTGDLSLITMK